MKSFWIAIVAAAILAGCNTVSEIADAAKCQVGLKQSAPSLLDAMQKGCHPKRGDKFVHDGRGVEVLHVLQSEGYVLARKELDLRSTDSILNRGLTIRIDSKNDYVKDELLQPGVEFSRNGLWTSIVDEAVLIDGGLRLAVSTHPTEGLKGAVAVAYVKNGLICHETVGTFFDSRGNEKCMMELQGIKWTGPDIIDDFC